MLDATVCLEYRARPGVPRTDTEAVGCRRPAGLCEPGAFGTAPAIAADLVNQSSARRRSPPTIGGGTAHAKCRAVATRSASSS
jgi:hypothetical protein